MVRARTLKRGDKLRFYTSKNDKYHEGTGIVRALKQSLSDGPTGIWLEVLTYQGISSFQPGTSIYIHTDWIVMPNIGELLTGDNWYIPPCQTRKNP